jgi:hypothetical protein
LFSEYYVVHDANKDFQGVSNNDLCRSDSDAWIAAGQRVNQMVEGKRLILELVEDADALAGSLGKGKHPHSVDEIKAAARKGLAKAGTAGLRENC